MSQRERDFIVNEMYPFWVNHDGMSDRNAERFYKKGYKQGMDVSVIHEEFNKMICAEIFADKAKTNGFALYKKSALVNKVDRICADIFGAAYGKTTVPVVDDIVIGYDDEFRGLI